MDFTEQAQMIDSNRCVMHEYAPMCQACGQPMDTTGEPPVCHGCGDCYDAPKQCIYCGED